MNTFYSKLQAGWDQGKFVCVGLDPDPAKFPVHLDRQSHSDIFSFNKAIIDATKDVAFAYKPQASYYEAFGSKGVAKLERTIEYIRSVAPNAVTILDAKRADIDSTNAGYVRSIFDHMGFDAVTLHPYLGERAMMPFLERADKGCIILCRTSNPGAAEFQDLLVDSPHAKSGKEKMYRVVARNVAANWNKHSSNCAIVVGATYPDETKEIRDLVPELPFLMPGFGAQGGDESVAVPLGRTLRGGMICNSARGIIYAGSGEDFADKARAAAQTFDKKIRTALAA